MIRKLKRRIPDEPSAIAQIPRIHPLLSCENWSRTHAFQQRNNGKETQPHYYERHHSPGVVMDMVRMESKRFGSVSEKILKELLELGPATSCQNDGTCLDHRVEIKVARYWSTGDCKWQHLIEHYDYEFVLFALLECNGNWSVWCIRKSVLFSDAFKAEHVITRQGQQGWWCKKSDILPFLHPIQSPEELRRFVSQVV